MGTTKCAYLAEGKLYLHDGTAERLVESPFVQGILERVERNRDRNDWKSQGMGWSLGAGGMQGFAAAAGSPAETRRIRFTGVTAGGQAGKILYTLDTDYVGGLFARDLVEDHEQRLLHRQQLRVRDISRRPTDGSLALSLSKDDGTAHLAVMGPEGRGLKQLTEGDAVDESPSWNVDGKTLLFQSAGVGRNAAGIRVGLGPYAVQQLDVDAEKVTTVVETDDHDYLLPRQIDGSLYYIRRPYQPHGDPVSPWKVALDVLLFPFRVIRAIVYFFNFLSLMFTRKPLMTAGGPPKDGPDQRHLMLWGRVIDAERILRKAKAGSGEALVPKSWELIRRDATGQEQTLATRVAAYDVSADGRLVYTDGTRVFLKDAPAADWKEIIHGKLVERVAIVD